MAGMTLLSGQRPSEVCGMAWDEIDPEGFWNIPAERTKSREAQRVPLTDYTKPVAVFSPNTSKAA